MGERPSASRGIVKIIMAKNLKIGQQVFIVNCPQVARHCEHCNSLLWFDTIAGYMRYTIADKKGYLYHLTSKFSPARQCIASEIYTDERKVQKAAARAAVRANKRDAERRALPE